MKHLKKFNESIDLPKSGDYLEVNSDNISYVAKLYKSDPLKKSDIELIKNKLNIDLKNEGDYLLSFDSDDYKYSISHREDDYFTVISVYDGVYTGELAPNRGREILMYLCDGMDGLFKLFDDLKICNTEYRNARNESNIFSEVEGKFYRRITRNEAQTLVSRHTEDFTPSTINKIEDMIGYKSNVEKKGDYICLTFYASDKKLKRETRLAVAIYSIGDDYYILGDASVDRGAHRYNYYYCDGLDGLNNAIVECVWDFGNMLKESISFDDGKLYKMASMPDIGGFLDKFRPIEFDVELIMTIERMLYCMHRKSLSQHGAPGLSDTEEIGITFDDKDKIHLYMLSLEDEYFIFMNMRNKEYYICDTKEGLFSLINKFKKEYDI